MKPLCIAAGALALALLGGSCAGGGVASETAMSPGLAVAEAPRLAPADTTGAVTTTTTTPLPTVDRSPAPLSPLAELVEPVGSLIPGPAEAAAPQPVALSVAGIGVDGADVVDVGVEPTGEMEIPGASEIGWYRWSPSPGLDGSAVLAAHIAYNGRDGVFRRLADVAVGAMVSVGYDDGSQRDFRIVEVAQYAKDELPFDRVFAKDGEPVLTLITCGGTFNRSLNSYDDNFVAYAVPV